MTAAAGSEWHIEGSDRNGIGPEVEADADSLRIKSQDDDEPWWVLGTRESWRIEVPADERLEVDLELNAGSSTVTLPGARLDTLDLVLNAGSTRIDLTWAAATDNVAVTGYRIERCQGASCTTFAQIAAPAGTGTTYSDTSAWRDDTLLAKWARIRTVRDAANKEIEALRAAGQVGSSLQAELAIGADIADHAILASLGDDLKFVTITSKATLEPADALRVTVTPSKATKCERCWHYRDDVGIDAAHPALCGRCVSNL